MNKKIGKLIACAAVMATVVAGSSMLFACNDTKEPQKLDAPVISLDGNVVSWAAVDHAASYDVTVGTATENTTDTSYTVSVTESGDYKITVTAKPADASYSASDKSNEVTYSYSAPSVDKELDERLTLDAPPTKTVYYLDEQATTLDLAGLQVKATYGDHTSKTLAAADLQVVGTIDFTAVGKKKVELKYTEGGGTALCDFRIEVKERTVADLDADNIEYVTAENEYSATAEKYKISNSALASVIDMTGAPVAVTTDANGTYVAAAMFAKSGAKLLKAGDTFINVTAAIYVSTMDDFKAIANNLDGYYILKNDISLDGYRVNESNQYVQYWLKGLNPIGAAPLRQIMGAEGPEYSLDLNAPDEELVQVGKPFTGTFDGKNHVISNLLVHFGESPAAKDGYCRAMFGYIGENGKVCNFTLRSSEFRGGQNSSTIAAVNRGTIENIVIDDNCKQYVEYAVDRMCGYVVDYNDGLIKNVVRHSTDIANRNGTITTEIPVAAQSTADAKTENCYLGNDTDLTSKLGSGWFHVEDYGTVIGTENYGKVMSYSDTVYLGQEFHVEIFTKSAVNTIEFLADWTANENADDLTPPILEVKSHNGNDYVVAFADDVTSDLFETVKMFVIGVKVNDVYIDSVPVTVGDPYVVELSQVVTQNITCIQNGSLSLSNINLKAVMSDGSEQLVHPTEVRNLDTATTGEKDVVFVYNDKTINGKVTVSASQGAITATLKQGVDKIIVPFDSGWSLENVNWAQYLDVSETDYDVSVEGAIYGESVTLTISKGALTPASVTADVWLGIADKTALRAIANDLAGRYVITADIAFDEGNGDAFAPIGAVDTARFTGVLDGGYKKISNLNLYSESGWAFGMIADNAGTIKNIVIVSGKAYSEASSASGVIAGVNRGGTIENCFVHITGITAANTAGGVGGICYANDAANSIVRNCVFVGEVKGYGTWAKSGILGNPDGGASTTGNLFIKTSTDGAQFAVGGAAYANNASIAIDDLVVNADGSYYDKNSPDAVYAGGLSEEIIALVRGCLPGGSAD